MREAPFRKPVAGLCRAATRLAIDHRYGAGIKLGITRRQLVERDMPRTGDHAAGDLGIGPHVKEYYSSVAPQCLQARTIYLVHGVA